jgi:hypothetical protein
MAMAQRLSVNQTRSFGSNKVVAGLAEKTADSKAKHKAHCWRLLKKASNPLVILNDITYPKVVMPFITKTQRSRARFEWTGRQTEQWVQ